MACPAVLAAVLTLAAPQDPVADGPRFAWPPVCDQPLRYKVALAKHRALADELAAASRDARAELGLDRGTPPRQSVELEIDVALRADDAAIRASYATRLVGRPRLRWNLAEPPAASRSAALGNDRLDVWGLPDDRSTAPAIVPRDAVERTFAREFRRGRGSGARPEDIGGMFGDHLLPVLWEQPLPCWIGHMANVVELAGEAAIEGKTLIRDGSGAFPLGHRETRVELEFTDVSGDTFTLRYEMKVKQVVTRTRDLADKLPRSWEWHLTVDGEARYHVGDAALEWVRETVTGHPVGMDNGQLARIRDEAFKGTIEVSRQRDTKRDERRRRGRQPRLPADPPRE